MSAYIIDTLLLLGLTGLVGFVIGLIVRLQLGARAIARQAAQRSRAPKAVPPSQEGAGISPAGPGAPSPDVALSTGEGSAGPAPGMGPGDGAQPPAGGTEGGGAPQANGSASPAGDEPAEAPTSSGSDDASQAHLSEHREAGPGLDGHSVLSGEAEEPGGPLGTVPGSAGPAGETSQSGEARQGDGHGDGHGEGQADGGPRGPSSGEPAGAPHAGAPAEEAADLMAPSGRGRGTAGTQSAMDLFAGLLTTEPSHPGRKPPVLTRPESGRADDLKALKGIGPVNEKALHRLGIFHFRQIAQWTPEEAEWVGSYLAFPGRIEREDWIGQAKALMAGTAPEDLPQAPRRK